MKKLVLILGLSFTCYCMFAQLKVASNGNTSIQFNGTPLSSLSIGGEGNSSYKVFVDANNLGIFSKRSGSSTDSWVYAIRAYNLNTAARYNVGLHGLASSTSVLNSGRAYGVYGVAGNSTSGYNYGVIGVLSGTQNGAGIVGAVNTSDINISTGQFAGWFQGNVNVTGTISGRFVGSSGRRSDLRLKENIVEIDGNTTLSKLIQLKPIEFNYKPTTIDAKSDTGAVNNLYKEQTQLFQKKEYGLIAQDLQKIYPNLVCEEQDGYLSIDYVEIIPLLIQSIKELKQEVDDLKSNGNSKGKPNGKFRSAQIIDSEYTGLDNSSEIAILYQNTPNPFNQTTEIKYYLPTTVSKASLYIYDMQGNQLKEITLSTRGYGFEIISSSEFNAGIYLYALLADGKEINVKRMILTK